MIVSDLRAKVLASLKSSSGRYPDKVIDSAAQDILQDLLTETECTILTGTVALTGTSLQVDMSGLTRFRANRLKRFEIKHFEYDDGIPWKIIDHKDYGTVARAIRARGTAVGTGNPSMFGFFNDDGTAYLDVSPGTVWERGRVFWADRLNDSWVVGGAGTSGANVTINIADEFLGEAIWEGIAAKCINRDPRMAWQSEGYQRYLFHREQVKARCRPMALEMMKNEDDVMD